MNPPKKQRKILVAEDDTPQRLLLKMALEATGFKVIEAADGVEALALFESDVNIRFVITDINMPLMNGFDLIRNIRKKERRYTYLIVLTNRDNKESVTKALRAGADDYLTKPVFQDELDLRLTAGERLLRLESQEELILSMAKLAEYRSQETGFHLERVQYYTRLLAMDIHERHPEQNLSVSMADEIARVSPLHDLGKISIPDQILHKPGQLTDEEFRLMQKHTVYGGSILLELYEKTHDNYLLVAYQVAMYHHEKWDGTGYPHGLKGEDIPIAARLVALADVYDAVSSNRCYKKCMDHNLAKSILCDGRGRHFDPMIVDAFLRQEDVWLTIREKYVDEEHIK
ncbi:HD-GYP domain-containing protein [Desulfolithobacter sp.]